MRYTVKDGGHIVANTAPGCWGPMITPELKGGHEVTKPVFVEGAEVGDAIAIHINSIRVTSMATASGNVPGFPQRRGLRICTPCRGTVKLQAARSAQKRSSSTFDEQSDLLRLIKNYKENPLQRRPQLPRLRRGIRHISQKTIMEADAIIIGTPIFQASIPGSSMMMSISAFYNPESMIIVPCRA